MTEDGYLKGLRPKKLKISPLRSDFSMRNFSVRGRVLGRVGNADQLLQTESSLGRGLRGDNG
jgi:hypothetical protein